MISPVEVGEWAERLSVGDDQVFRDHLISHLLAALGDLVSPDTVFFGGTALCRTHLPDLRLSEDVDLLVDDPSVAASGVADGLARRLRREFPDLAVSGPRRGPRSSNLGVEAPGVEPVQLQLVRIEPAERRLDFVEHDVVLRYSDLPPTVICRVPTPASFVAMKAMTWRDRKAPRDLFDLAGLARAGAVDAAADALLKNAVGVGLTRTAFDRLPASTASSWETELRHQVGTLPSPESCLLDIRTALERLAG